MAKVLHPVLKARAAAVKQAHAELSKQPGFRALPPHEQFKRTQTHIRRKP